MHSARSLVVALVLAGSPAVAEEAMTASTAQKFVAGKHFSYICFDGTAGSGRVFSDGSARGTIRPGGEGETRHMRLPSGTLYVSGDRICANLRGLPFQPCFNLTKLSDTAFRGSVSGLGFMYCEFDRGGETQIARRRAPSGFELRGSLTGALPAVP